MKTASSNTDGNQLVLSYSVSYIFLRMKTNSHPRYENKNKYYTYRANMNQKEYNHEYLSEHEIP